MNTVLYILFFGYVYACADLKTIDWLIVKQDYKIEKLVSVRRSYDPPLPSDTLTAFLHEIEFPCWGKCVNYIIVGRVFKFAPPAPSVEASEREGPTDSWSSRLVLSRMCEWQGTRKVRLNRGQARPGQDLLLGLPDGRSTLFRRRESHCKENGWDGKSGALRLG